MQVAGATVRTLDGNVTAAWSDASRGDLRPAGHGPDDGRALAGFASDLARIRGDTIERVVWQTQVHGSGVGAVPWDVTASAPAEAPAEAPAICHLGVGDALVSASPGVALCVLTADCAPLALSSPEGIFGAVHAGWRGLVDGVVERSIERMRGIGATDVTAVLGPCIHAPCYEFAAAELGEVAATYGPAVRGATSDGDPALDLVAGVAAAVTVAGARMVDCVDACTACGTRHFSHRARADSGRQALLVWSSSPPDAL